MGMNIGVNRPAQQLSVQDKSDQRRNPDQLMAKSITAKVESQSTGEHRALAIHAKNATA
jgi:hypothetical protein